MKTEVRRPYRMAARADKTAATRDAITAAWLGLFLERHYGDITLDLVAARARVTVQTVIRHFGSKEELVARVIQQVGETETPRRAVKAGGTAEEAVHSVVGHYERIGELVLRVLAQEDGHPGLKAAADIGRRVHRDWVETAFEHQLRALSARQRRTLRAQLVALTDIYVWKLLRRDQGFGRRQTEIAMTEMVTALLEGDR